MPDAPFSTSGRAGYSRPTGAFWQAFPCGNHRSNKGLPRPEKVRHLCPLRRMRRADARPTCLGRRLLGHKRHRNRLASLGTIAFPARHSAGLTQCRPDPKRLRNAPARRTCQGRVMTTLPVACRVRSRSSPSTARSSGRTWLICGVKAPSANHPNSLAMLAVSTSGRKAR